MKSVYKIVLSSLLIFALCACEKGTSLSDSKISNTPTTDNGAAEVFSQANDEYYATVITEGWFNDIKVTVYVDSQGNISNVLSEDNETAGLGTKAIQEMSEAMIQENGEFVDAVSGATVSSLAFRKAAGEAYMIAYAKSHGMVCSDPDNPMVGVWRWDSNNVNFEKLFWLVYPDGLLVPYSVERNEYMVSLRDIHQDQRKVIYLDSTLSLIRNDDINESLPIEWIDPDHFSLPSMDEFYYSASRVQIDDDILSDEDSAAVRNLDTKDGLTLQRLCESAWASNGYRFSDTAVYQFIMDGTVKITYPVSMPDEYSGTFELWDDTVVITWGSKTITLSYNKEKNILINMDPSVTHIIEQDHGDSEGNYVPAKTAREIYEPYSAVPYLDSNTQAQRQSVVPEEFAVSRIKETVRPYLQALSYISIPQKYCEISWDDTFMDENGMTYSRVTNYNSVEEAMAVVAPYVTDEYLQARFQSNAFQLRNGKLYLIESSMGWPSWDANSVVYAGLIGMDEIAVNVDLYNSGGVYSETKTVYLKEVNGEYEVSGISWLNVEEASYIYVSPGYDPV